MVAIGNVYANKIQTLQVAQMVKSGQIDESQLSLFSETTGVSQGMLDGSCTDGADDGKISFGEGVKSFLKGAVKSLIPTSFGDFLKKAAIGVGCAALVAVTGGAAAPFLIAGGAIAGGIQAGKGIYNATQARTDAEAKAALEDVGGGATTIAASVVAGKAYTNATGNALIGKGSLSTYKNAATQSAANVKTNFGNLTSSAKTAASNIKTNVKNSFENFKANHNNSSTNANSTSPYIEQADGQLTFNLDDVSSSANTTTNTAKIKGFGNKLVNSAKNKIKFTDDAKALNELIAENPREALKVFNSEIRTEYAKSLKNTILG